jgi:non-specific serine/threonine protein kinase/serine/threonine-protein kinase PknK
MYAAIPDYFVLVLEDYHFVQDSEPAKRILDILVNRAPDNCHIIISSRTSVDLSSVASLMFQRRASSLGAWHLSFTAMEVKELLAKQHGLHLSDERAEKLTTEAEGWIAGILLSTYGRRAGTPSTNVLTLSRQDIFRYLASEVFERQSPEIKRFLLASSTLNDMEPETCEQLTGIANCQKLFQDIERRNLFIARVDSEKVWYRYHHLFRQFLQGKLLGETPRSSRFCISRQLHSLSRTSSGMKLSSTFRRLENMTKL